MECGNCYDLMELGIWDTIKCCDSCHEDWNEEDGYEMYYITIKGIEYHICCNALNNDSKDMEMYIKYLEVE